MSHKESRDIRAVKVITKKDIEAYK